jgi:putative endonuclease
MQALIQGGYVYIMSNKLRTVLYTGVTSDLQTRAQEHKDHKYPDAFSARYNCEYLMWYERHTTIDLAIAAEKRIKGGNRKKKIALIEAMNPDWIDLHDSLW